MTPRPPLGIVRPLARTLFPREVIAPGRTRPLSMVWRRPVRRPSGFATLIRHAPHFALTLNLAYSHHAGAVATLRERRDQVPSAGSAAAARLHTQRLVERLFASGRADSAAPGHAPLPERRPLRIERAAARSVGPAERLAVGVALGAAVAPSGARAPAELTGRASPAERRLLTGILAERDALRRAKTGSLILPPQPVRSPRVRRDRLVIARIERTLIQPLVNALRHTATAPTSAQPRVRRSLSTPLSLAAPAAAGAAQRAPEGRPSIARARPVERIWATPRNGGGEGTAVSLVQPQMRDSVGAAAGFVASADAARPIAAAAAVPTAPDVNLMVDEVMRRIDRRLRSEKLRRGM